jgi:DNA-binding MarR family transcriptional regulator
MSVTLPMFRVAPKPEMNGGHRNANIRREHSDSDRRGVYVALTDEGVAKLETLWPYFTTSIEQHFGRHLSRADVEAITLATSKILQADDA